MVWREVLVFADGSEDGSIRFRLAHEIAHANQAHLEVVVATPIIRPVRGWADDYFFDHYDALLRAVREQAADAVVTLRQIADDPPDLLSIHSLEALTGEMRALAARCARSVDLVVVGQPEKLDGSDLDSDLFVGAVLGGGRPCLMVPRWVRPHNWGKRALIAWKGSPEAARAVQGALPLLKSAEAVRICVSNPRGEYEGEDEASLSRLSTYLLRHGVRVEETVVRQSWEGAARMFVSEIEGFGADLLVMGAYGRPRAQEIIFGGMTEDMMREARIPILFAH